MEILEIEKDLLWEFEYLQVGPTGEIAQAWLPVHRARVAALPDGLRALLCTGDLQGIVVESTAPVPVQLGLALAGWLPVLSEMGVLPAPKQTGVLLTGDLFARPQLDKRGGSGDVRPVWQAFADSFRWVAGVAGNHDTFGDSPRDFVHFKQQESVHFLDGEIIDLNGLRIAGVGGIVGNPRRPFRRTQEQMRALQAGLLKGHPDILLLHESSTEDYEADGPPAHSRHQHFLYNPPGLLICHGHRHSLEPLTSYAGGTQILNVDARVVLLETCS